MKGRWLLFGLVLLALVTPARAGTVVEVKLDDIIHPITADYITAGIAHAEETNAAAVLLWVNTPGGLLDSVRVIVDRISTSRVPVIVYVAPTGSHATSGGYFLLMAADVATMAPGTTAGAASPVLSFGGEMPETLRKKAINDTAAYLRSFVSKRGRPVEVAELAVTEAKSFTDQEALAAKLIDGIFPSRDELLRGLAERGVKRFDGREETLALAGATITPFEMTARQRFLAAIIDPNVAFLLLVFGVLGIYIEFNHPGAILPGVAGGICLLLALFALNVLPVNTVGVLLIALAFALFILEAKFASHGILGAGGVVAMVIGALMLIESPPIPELRVKWEIALGVAVPFAIIIVVLLRSVIRSRLWPRAVGREALVGAVGEVREDIEAGKKGLVLVQGELWRAASVQRLRAGESVRVVAVDGLMLQVEPAGDARLAGKERG